MTSGINNTSMAINLLKIMEPLGRGAFYVIIDNNHSKDKKSSSMLPFRRLLRRDILPTRRHQHQDRCTIMGSNKDGLRHKAGLLRTMGSNKGRVGWLIRYKRYGAGLAESRQYLPLILTH